MGGLNISLSKVRERPKQSRQPSIYSANVLVGALSVLLLILAWYWAAARSTPLFLPSPTVVVRTAIKLIQDGTLLESMWVSFLRIMAGWGIGCGAGIVLGLLMGRIPWVKAFVEPYIGFFRFVPAISFLTLAIIWFGMGEASKIILIVYNTVFVVALNTVQGALSVPDVKLRAAASLGAGPRQTLLYVVLPSTLPFIFSGIRIAMGNSFITIVASEMLAAQAGVGFLIWNARTFMQTDVIFVAVLTLGLMGLATDAVMRALVQKLGHRYRMRS